MDKVVGRTPRKQTLRAIAQTAPAKVIRDGYAKLWSLAELHGITSRYLLDNVGKYIRANISDIAHDHAPFALAFACQCTPPDVAVIHEALQAFESNMPTWMDDYFTPPSPLVQDDYLSPAAVNLTRSFARDLGAEGVLAYLNALDANRELVKEGDDIDWNWAAVARSFIREMQLEKQWNLMDGHDTDSESERDAECDEENEGEESDGEGNEEA